MRQRGQGGTGVERETQGTLAEKAARISLPARPPAGPLHANITTRSGIYDSVFASMSSHRARNSAVAFEWTIFKQESRPSGSCTRSTARDREPPHRAWLATISHEPDLRLPDWQMREVPGNRSDPVIPDLAIDQVCRDAEFAGKHLNFVLVSAPA